MTNYVRVAPRDCFNEGLLLQCYGNLMIRLGEVHDHQASIDLSSAEFFDIRQDDSSGGITVHNMPLFIGGVRHFLQRPLNTKDRWSLFVIGNTEDPDFEEVEVFDENGRLSLEMLDLIGARKANEE